MVGSLTPRDPALLPPFTRLRLISLLILLCKASARSCPLRRARRSLFIIIILWSYLPNTLAFRSRHARLLHYNEPYFKHQPERKHIMKMDRAESDFLFLGRVYVGGSFCRTGAKTGLVSILELRSAESQGAFQCLHTSLGNPCFLKSFSFL